MKWGIIGYGSIGKRHSDNILHLQDEVVVLTKNPDCSAPRASSLEDLILDHTPDIALICNETSLHEDTYRAIRALNPKLPILVEKPLFAQPLKIEPDPNTFVAYCLRFHPLVTELKKRIANENVLAATFYVGQYLPSWRPGRPYQSTYSARKDLGGGVLRDLSHELDLASFLLGPLELEFAKSAHISNLDIDSDDYFAGFFNAETCPNVTVEMNYLDQITQRYLILHTNDKTIRVDFIQSEITTNSKVEKFSFNKNQMYLTMLEKMRNKDWQDFAKFEDGLQILNLIAQAEEDHP